MSRIRKLLAPFLLCLSMISLSAFPSFASAYEVAVSISVETDTSAPVDPRAEVPYRVTVNNLLGQSWIRLHVKTDSTGIGSTFNNDYINASSGWIRKGDYYYYTSKAPKSTSIQALDNFRVPDITSSKGATVTLAVYAEAIDVRSVTPDFSLDDPWKGKTPDSVAGDSFNTSGRGSSRGTGISGYVFSKGLNRYSAPQVNAIISSGSWYKVNDEQDLWKFGDASTNSYASDGWYFIRNGYSKGGSKDQWFRFDKNGIMETGWAQNSGTDWYHLHEVSDGDLGALTTGWYLEPQDKRWYYLDESLGLMKSGWQIINGKSYYFTTLSDVGGPTWAYQLLSNTSVGRWLYEKLHLRSYGSMYCDERTPDGFLVDKNGAWIDE